MYHLRLPVTALMAVLFLCSCNRSTVVLDYTNAKDEVPRLGNLIFRFDKPLVPDSLLNQWDSTEYISFEPRIAGRFRWEHPDELVFSPLRPLPPATSFKASFNRYILQTSPYGRLEKTSGIAFRTPDLKVDDINIVWVLQDEHTRSAIPQVNLHLNYPVEPSAIKEKLMVETDGKRTDYNLQNLSADNTISLRLYGIKAEDREYTVRLVLNKGLVPMGGSNGTKETIEKTAVAPSPFVMNISDVSTEHNGTQGTVTVKTSQQLSDSMLASFLTISPAVKFSTQVTEEGFIVSSDNFDVSKSYELTIAKGLRGKLGGVLKEDYDNNFVFGKMQPSISISNAKAVYLSGQGLKNIEVKITNVPKVKVVVSKIYENNLIASQQYGYYPRESASKDKNEEAYNEPGDFTLGDVLYEKEIDTRSLPRNGNNSLFNFSIEDRLPGFKGIYHIMIRSTKDYWVRDSRFISLSDIGLVAREGREKIYVFANSINTAEPVNGANILVYGSNNQLLGTAATNADGMAEIAYARKDFAGFHPSMVIAKTAADFNYLPFSNTKVATSRFDVGGKHGNATGLDAFIYAERDIYRPGERVNFSVVVRDKSWHAPGDLPLKLKFLMPNGKELKSMRKTLNPQGSVLGDVDISSAAVTGTYSLEVYSSTDILLATKSFMVEEFVPDRIKVSARLDKQALLPGDAARLMVNAVNFFGPPAANRNYEMEIQVKQKMFATKRFTRFDFSLANQNSFFDKLVTQGKTDVAGNASELYKVPGTYSNIGVLQANFYATVFDETGRPVSRSVSADIYTQTTFLGLGSDDNGYYPLNQAIKFPVIAVDKNEALLNGVRAQVRVVRHEYRTVVEKSGSYFSYQSQKHDKLISEAAITINGENTMWSFVPSTPGDYEVRVYLPGANSYVSRSFYSYGSWGGDNSSFAVNNEGNIDIETDKSSYQVGETAKVLFKTPFSGRMLVTMESDKLISYQYVNVEKRSFSLDTKLTAEELPNFYVTATLIKPHAVSDIPLTVAHGFQSLVVEEKARKMKVDIIAQKTSRSSTHQRVKVKAQPGSYVTLSAVDNGVLQVSDFKTPDPYNYFYGRKALEVNGYDIYTLLFPEVRARLSSTGGDAGMEMSKRTNPMPNKRVKIISYWSGLVQANGNGDAQFDFDIPPFSGQVRLMAVAYRDQAFGSAEAAITVSDPIVISSALPRFLSPSDTLSVPVTISNTTTRNTTAVAVIKTTGPLQVSGNNSQTLALTANSEARALFRLVAAPSVQAAKVVVEVQSGGEKFSQETDITVRPASTLQKATGTGTIASNTSQRLTIPSNDFLPGSFSYRLVAGRSPVLQVTDQLNYLVQFPFGCTEQVISAAFPQLYYGDFAQLLLVNKSSATNANADVQEAVRKIKMRQLYNGGVLLWDNEGTENWWVTIYAAHFLVEAKKAGYDVDDALLETLLAYITAKLKNRETINYYYNRNQQRKIAPKEVAYSLYVLALANRSDVSVMNYYKANPQVLSLDGRYLLSAAFAVAGDKIRFRQLLPASFSGEESVPQTGGSFYSDIRDEAIALNVLIDVDPANAQVPVMAQHVLDKLKQRSWYSTQESAFSFLALGKLARSAAKSTITADIKVGGKLVSQVAGGIASLTQKELGGTNIDIQTKGEGRLYFWWQSEGIRLSGGYTQEDSYIKVRRKFFDRFGREIAGNSFHQNDLIVVQLTLEKSYSGSVNNIVITDLLPAGFEIENPRIREVPGMDWIKDASNPTQLDIRDDRINLFTDLVSRRQTYYYAARAVSPGVFKMGPVSADAMYNGEYHSYNGGGTIRIVP